MACVVALLIAALENPGSTCIFLSLTRKTAKKNAWRPLLDANRDFHLRGKSNETDLRLELPNGSTIYLTGANDKTEIEKERGAGLALVIIDEAQGFPQYFAELIDEVLAPALMDYDGSLILAGTPGPVPGGYFWNAANNDGWAHHSWTVWSNPYIEAKSGRTNRQLLDKELKRRGVRETDAIIRREWFGEWAYDDKALVFAYKPEVNGFAELPKLTWPNSTWEHVIGVDLGFDDADAISVLAWSEERPEAYLVEELVTPKQTISDLGKQLKAMDKKYKPQAIVMDTGGLGKKITEELQPRFEIGLEAADKMRKNEHIELLNDAIRTKRFFARPNGRFAQDARVMEWDFSIPEKPKIAKSSHSDIGDSVLYSFIKCLNWLHTPKETVEIVTGSREWYIDQEKRMKAQICEAVDRRQAEAEEERALADDGWEEDFA